MREVRGGQRAVATGVRASGTVIARRCGTVVVATCLLATGITGPGCSDAAAETKRSAADRALSDPMNYGPKPGKTDTPRKAGEPTSDREALNRELQRVLDP